MKNFLFFALLLTSLFSQAQKPVTWDELPQDIRHFFPVVYPLPPEVQVDWTFTDTVYIAKFTTKGYPVEVAFKDNGFWVQTEWTMDYQTLPIAIRTYIEKNYITSSIVKASLTNNAFEEFRYHVFIVPKDKKLRQKNILFSLQGEFMSEVEF